VCKCKQKIHNDCTWSLVNGGGGPISVRRTGSVRRVVTPLVDGGLSTDTNDEYAVEPGEALSGLSVAVLASSSAGSPRFDPPGVEGRQRQYPQQGVSAAWGREGSYLPVCRCRRTTKASRPRTVNTTRQPPTTPTAMNTTTTSSSRDDVIVHSNDDVTSVTSGDVRGRSASVGEVIVAGSGKTT